MCCTAIFQLDFMFLAEIHGEALKALKLSESELFVAQKHCSVKNSFVHATKLFSQKPQIVFNLKQPAVVVSKKLLFCCEIKYFQQLFSFSGKQHRKILFCFIFPLKVQVQLLAFINFPMQRKLYFRIYEPARHEERM